MTRAVVAAIALSLAAGVSAQERQHRGSQRPTAEVVPPSRIVPPILSTRLPTILPPPPPTSPFAARPDTYAPRFDRLPHVNGGVVLGVPFYANPTVSSPPPETSVSDRREASSAPAPEPPKAAEPAPEPPKMAALHGPDLFYVIPGCYAGNRPPNPERLPKGCDLTKLRTLPIR